MFRQLKKGLWVQTGFMLNNSRLENMKHFTFLFFTTFGLVDVGPKYFGHKIR